MQQGGTEGKRVAALVGDGFEEAELAEPRRVLEAAGAIVTIVGVGERARQRIRGKRGLDDSPLALKAEELVVDCTAEDFDALLIPGGQSPDHIRADREVQRFVRELDAAKKPMFSIGHGAQVLISSQVARGRTLTGSPSIGDDIRNAGGLYRDQPVVQDGHWVTSRGGSDLNQFSRAIVERLATASAPLPA
jgi:protease I